MSEEIKEKILNLAEPIVRDLGLRVWGLDIVPGPVAKVRLFIDLPLESSGEGDERLSANIDQCELVSRRLGLALEVEDVFPNPWVLEVSSPGLERKFYNIEQMVPYIGDVIEVATRAPIEGFGSRKVFKGKLTRADGDSFELDLCSIGEDGQSLPENLPPARIPFDVVRNARRVHVFAAPRKPRKRGDR